MGDLRHIGEKLFEDTDFFDAFLEDWESALADAGIEVPAEDREKLAEIARQGRARLSGLARADEPSPTGLLKDYRRLQAAEAMFKDWDQGSPDWPGW